MQLYTLDELKERVSVVVRDYNEDACEDDRIVRVSLLGSYADGKAVSTSDVDLLIAFQSAVVSLFTLARVLAALEDGLEVPVDVVQDPMPKDSLLVVKKVVPLYEGGGEGSAV